MNIILTLQNFAYIAISTSAMIALLTFIASQFETYKNNKNNEIRKWQSVLIYSILDKYGELDFDQVKSYYLQKAQQNLKLNIPKKEIQDESLLRVLLELVEKRIIFYTIDKTYDINFAKTNKDEINQLMLNMIEKKEKLSRLIPDIYNTLDQTTKKFSTEFLYRHLKEEIGIDIDYNDFTNTLLIMKRQGLVIDDENGILVIKKVHNKILKENVK